MSCKYYSWNVVGLFGDYYLTDLNQETAGHGRVYKLKGI